MDHRHPGPGVGGVTGMEKNVDRTTPGTGLMATPDSGSRPVAAPYPDDATLPLIYRNMLVGGEPGSGKSGPFRLLVADEALSVGDGTLDGGRTGAEG